MNLGQAIEELKNGKKVARRSWIEKGKFIYLVNGHNVSFEQLRGAAAKHLEADKPNNRTKRALINSHIDMRMANGAIAVGWVASQNDMLAEDWEVVE